MLRIYVDFNTAGMDPKGRVWINTLVRPELLPHLTAPARVLIYDETLEVQGNVEFDAQGSRWLVTPDWSTKKDLL